MKEIKITYGIYVRGNSHNFLQFLANFPACLILLLFIKPSNGCCSDCMTWPVTTIFFKWLPTKVGLIFHTFDKIKTPFARYRMVTASSSDSLRSYTYIYSCHFFHDQLYVKKLCNIIIHFKAPLKNIRFDIVLMRIRYRVNESNMMKKMNEQKLQIQQKLWC